MPEIIENDKKAQKNKGKQLSKRYVNPDSVKAEFINDMSVNHSESEFFLSFWRTEPPTILRPEDMEALEGVDTVLVAKVVVTPEFADKIMKALQKNLKSFEDHRENK